MNICDYLIKELHKIDAVLLHGGICEIDFTKFDSSLDIVASIIYHLYPHLKSSNAKIVRDDFGHVSTIRIRKCDYDCIRDSVKIQFINNTGITRYSSYARCPYYQIRGKKISLEQAFDAISRLDIFLYRAIYDYSLDIQDAGNNEISCELRNRVYNDICSQGYQGFNNLFKTDYFGNSFQYCGGFIHTDGNIGYNGTIYKYPFCNEILPYILNISASFEYLDFIVVITYWNECCPSRSFERYGVYDSADYPSRDDYDTDEEYSEVCYRVEDKWEEDHPNAWDDEWDRPYDKISEKDIELAIHVQHNKVDILAPEEAVRMLNLYDSQYGNEDSKRFLGSCYYSHTNEIPIGVDYFSRALNRYDGVPKIFKDKEVENYCNVHRV